MYEVPVATLYPDGIEARGFPPPGGLTGGLYHFPDFLNTQGVRPPTAVRIAYRRGSDDSHQFGMRLRRSPQQLPGEVNTIVCYLK